MPVPTSDMCTKNIGSYPEPLVLLRRCVAFVILGEIAAAGFDQWLQSQYDFDVGDHELSAWFWWEGEVATLGYDNQQGDMFEVTFTPDGVVIAGFAHEYPMTPYSKDPPEVWPGMFAGLPSALGEVVSEAFREMVTFCVWWTPASGWQRGVDRYDADAWYEPDPDGSGFLLAPLGADDAKTAAHWSHEYGELLPARIDASCATALKDEREITEELVHRINPKADVDSIRSFAASCRYGSLDEQWA